jgi:hypothetical protein
MLCRKPSVWQHNLNQTASEEPEVVQLRWPCQLQHSPEGLPKIQADRVKTLPEPSLTARPAHWQGF